MLSREQQQAHMRLASLPRTVYLRPNGSVDSSARSMKSAITRRVNAVAGRPAEPVTIVSIETRIAAGYTPPNRGKSRAGIKHAQPGKRAFEKAGA